MMREHRYSTGIGILLPRRAPVMNPETKSGKAIHESILLSKIHNVNHSRSAKLMPSSGIQCLQELVKLGSSHTVDPRLRRRPNGVCTCSRSPMAPSPLTRRRRPRLSACRLCSGARPSFSTPPISFTSLFLVPRIGRHGQYRVHMKAACI